MVQLGYRATEEILIVDGPAEVVSCPDSVVKCRWSPSLTTEEMLIVAWTALLTWIPKCRLSPALCDFMTDKGAILGVAVVVGVLVILSQWLPYTRFGKINPYRDPAPDKTICSRFSDAIENMTLLEGLRILLGILLPLLGTMVTLHPGCVALMCLLKKAVMLEKRLWHMWCPEAYILMVSIACMLVIARRSIFSQKLGKHDRFRRQSHAHFYNPDPRFNYGMA